MLLTSAIGATLLACSLPYAALARPQTSSGGTSTTSTDSPSQSSTDSSGGGQYTNAKFTYYNPSVGLGACGKQNDDESFTVALNAGQFGTSYPSPFCEKTITITYNGKTADAVIMDSCPGCPEGGLDLSEGLFRHFEDLGTGVIYGSWSFTDGSGGGSSGSPAPTGSESGGGSSSGGSPSTTSGDQSGSTGQGGPTPSGSGPDSTATSGCSSCNCGA